MADTDAKSIFDTDPDEAEQARLDEKAARDFRAGRFVTHERVAKWLKSWGTRDELPCPEPEPD